MENCDVVFYNVTSGLSAMDQLREIIDPSINDKPEVTFKEIPILAEAFERYRWPTTMALQGIRFNKIAVQLHMAFIELMENWGGHLLGSLQYYNYLLTFRYFCNILPAAVYWCHCAFSLHINYVQRLWALLDYLPLANCFSLPDCGCCYGGFLYVSNTICYPYAKRESDCIRKEVFVSQSKFKTRTTALPMD